MLYLSFASFPLYLLTKDKNTFPRIDSVRVYDTAEQPRVRGVNFAGSQVTAASGIRRSVSTDEKSGRQCDQTQSMS
jgi:hypothetical protein